MSTQPTSHNRRSTCASPSAWTSTMRCAGPLDLLPLPFCALLNVHFAFLHAGSFQDPMLPSKKGRGLLTGAEVAMFLADRTLCRSFC